MNAVRMKNVKYTVADIYALPDGKRAELIDGEIFYLMSPPNTQHQRIITMLIRTIGDHIEKKGGKCEVFTASFGVFLFNDDENYVEPDISVVCNLSKLGEDGCHGAPDWIIEIISPSSRKMDCITKKNKYMEAGVREYWIVDPEAEAVLICDFENGKEMSFSFKNLIKSVIFDLEMDFLIFSQQ